MIVKLTKFCADPKDMKSVHLLPWLAVAAFVACAQPSKKSKLIANGAQPELISSSFSFTEGPAVDREGNVFFTDQPNNRILKWTPGSGVSVFMEDAGRSNGLYFDRAGNLFACADEKNELWQIAPDKTVTVLVRDFEDKRLNGPNDLWVDHKGGIYFTDPFYQRSYWSHTEPEIGTQDIYYLSPDRSSLRKVMGDFSRPNGIIGSPDGRLLYVADIGAGKTYAFGIQPDGSLTDRKLFAEMGSDGMTLDAKGNLYITGKGITVFNSSGEKVEHIAIDEPWTANVCFGGRKGKTLFITASKSVYTLEMKVRGAGL